MLQFNFLKSQLLFGIEKQSHQLLKSVLERFPYSSLFSASDYPYDYKYIYSGML